MNVTRWILLLLLAVSLAGADAAAADGHEGETKDEAAWDTDAPPGEWETLRAGTIDGARYLGIPAQLGSLERGKLADIVIIDGNPLDDLRQSEQVRYTMLNGRLYDAATMNEIGTGDHKTAPFSFEGEAGDVYSAAGMRAFEQKAHVYH